MIPSCLWNLLRKPYRQFVLRKWRTNGSQGSPPPSYKRQVLKEYQEKYSCSVLVETGTAEGNTIEELKRRFQQIYSIELSPYYFGMAKEKFKNDRNITLLQGDSGKMLPQIMETITEPALFWLDGHYSAGITAKGEKECPILEELDAIFSARPLPHVLLIDDAREFVGKNDYPTLEELKAYLAKKNGQYHFEVKDDIIRCTP